MTYRFQNPWKVRLENLHGKKHNDPENTDGSQQNQKEDNQSDEDNRSEEEMSEGEDDEGFDKEIETYLGIDPATTAKKETNLNDGLIGRIKTWTKKGFADKVEKDAILAAAPTLKHIDLTAPDLNEEIAIDLNQKALAKDNHFKQYQNLAGAALTSMAAPLDVILNEVGEFPQREMVLANLANAVKLQSELYYNLNQARKLFVVGRFEEKMQKVLKNTDSTKLLFGDNLKTTIENAKSVEKAAKELLHKNHSTSSTKNNLNSRSPNKRYDPKRRGGYKQYPYPRSSNSNNSRPSQSRYKPAPYPARRNYNQSQPQRDRK